MKRITLVLAAIVLPAVWGAPSLAAGNYSTNPGFELEGTNGQYSAAGWEGGSNSYGRTDEDAHSGTCSWKVAVNIQWAGAFQNTNVAGLAGREVTLSVYAMTPSADPLDEQIIVKFEWLGVTGYSENYFTLSPGAWTKCSAPGMVAPSGATGVRTAIMKNDVVNGTVYFDDVELAITSAPEPGALRNPSFEIEGATPANPASWSVGPNWIRTNAVAYDGEWSMRLDFAGAEYWPNLKQYVSVDSSYGSYAASVYAITPSSNPIQDGDAGVIKLEYIDGGGAKIGDKDHYFINQDSPVDTWLKGEITDAIPTGTAQILFLVMTDATGAGNSGYVFFDKACLVLAAKTDFVKNQGFETEGCEGEMDAAFWDQANGGARSSNVVHAGDWSMQLSGSGVVTNCVRQQFDYFFEQGEEYIVGVYGRHPSSDPLDPGESALLKVELLYESGEVAPSGTFETTVLTSASPTDTWIEGHILVTVPDGGADAMSIQLRYDNPDDNGKGTVYFDDVSVVPEPVSAALLAVGVMLLSRKRD